MEAAEVLYLGTAFGGPTPFSLEAQLLPPLAAWLEAAGYRVRAEVPILGRRADLVGSRGEAVAAVELKLHDWSEALSQAMAYQVGADLAWVAMPLASASRAYRQRWRFEAQGVGLIAVDDVGAVRTPIPAGPSPRLLPFVREAVLRSCARPTVFEIGDLPQDPMAPEAVHELPELGPVEPAVPLPLVQEDRLDLIRRV